MRPDTNYQLGECQRESHSGVYFFLRRPAGEHTAQRPRRRSGLDSVSSVILQKKKKKKQAFVSIMRRS